jgi:hypothetical protein
MSQAINWQKQRKKGRKKEVECIKIVLKIMILKDYI